MANTNQKGSYKIRYHIDEQKLFDGIFKNLNAVLQNNEFKFDKNQLLADYCDPYVPYKTGMLANNVEISETGVRYLQPYAWIQYHNIFNHTTDFHPLATDHWQAAMMRDRREEFLIELGQLIAEYNRRGAKNL